MAPPLAEHGLLLFPRAALWALRAALMRDVGEQAAGYLQDAGYAGGAALFERFRTAQSAAADADAPADAEPGALDVPSFARAASEFFRDAGWGSLEIGVLHDAVVTLDTSDWTEADPAGGLDNPGCYVTTGLFADFFGRLAGAPLAVLEVECRSMGSPRCRFLLGSESVMEHVYEELGRGVEYADALSGPVARS